jgi:hypothetical protein
MSVWLPAAATTTTPRRLAYRSAFSTSGISAERTSAGNSSDRLITSARWRAAYRIARAIAAESPSPFASSTRSGMILALKAIPAVATRLLVVCAIVPVTCVPWP